MRIVQISDTHLSHLGGVMCDNFSLLVDFVNDVLKPDLVVNSGDLVILSPDSSEDREAVRAAHERFAAPVRIIPGNHDVGMPGDHPWMGIATTAERVANFRSVFGSDRFLELVDPSWAIVGMNSEILSTGLDEEAEQWEWLDEVGEQVRGRSVLLFLHRPLRSPMPAFTEHELALGDVERARLLECFASARLRAVGSGHLHRYLQGLDGDVITVSAPSTAFIGRDPAMQTGLNQLGVVEYRIEGDDIEAYFRSIPALVEDEPFAIPAFIETMARIESAASSSS
jgi:3',5'-cyclic AMP phosphodiesterase CpdA